MTLSRVALVHREDHQFTVVYLEGTVQDTFGLKAVQRVTYAGDTTYHDISKALQRWIEHGKITHGFC